jgi:hypothetical protein
MNTQRITAKSKANIQAADRAEIVELKDLEGDRFTVKIWKNERCAFIMGSQSVIVYPTAHDARRAVKRIRKDLELTSFSL